MGSRSWLRTLGNSAERSRKLLAATRSACRQARNSPGVGVDLEKIPNFEFTDNLVGVGEAEIFPTGGGPANCAFQPRAQGPANVVSKCFANSVVTRNVFIGSSKGWPAGNFYVGDASSVVEDFQGGKNGNYRLCRGGQPHCKKAPAFAGTSPGGKDPGADVQAVNTATAGVE